MMYFIRLFPPVCLLVFLLYGTFEVFHDRTIATIQPISVIPSPVIPGAAASILYQGTESRHCDGVLHQWVIDSKGTLYPLDDASVFHTNATSDPKKIIIFSRSVPVPRGMSNGTAEYHADVSRWCNSFQQLLYPVHDSRVVKFEVRGTK